jgi:hypothetical protein
MNQIGIPNLDKKLEASLIADMVKVEELMRSHIQGDYPLVVETSRHLVEAGGKRLRPLLTLIAAQFGDPTNHSIHNRSMLEHYHKFSIELVCETYTLGNTFFPTEKTVRPIMGTKPWLIHGAPGYINNLKLMGFQSFNALWDESYDQLEGSARWQAMQKIIDTLTKLNSVSLRMLLEQAHQIALFNRQVLNTFLIHDSQNI